MQRSIWRSHSTRSTTRIPRSICVRDFYVKFQCGGSIGLTSGCIQARHSRRRSSENLEVPDSTQPLLELGKGASPREGPIS